MATASLFNPYANLPDSAAGWLYDPPDLAGPVGWAQLNFPEDVLLVQRIVNMIIDGGYLEGQLVARLMETGSWDDDLDFALGAIEDTFLSGLASPFSSRLVENGSPLFVFMVRLVSGSADVVSHCSRMMYQLASVMLPQGARNGNLRVYLPYILQALAHNGLGDMEMVLMALATIAAESIGVAPISEEVSRFNTSPAARQHVPGTHLFDLYDNRRDLGNLGAPDGASFKGRGFVQLTGRSNYNGFGRDLGWSLTDQPGLGNDPWVAAVLLVRFLKAHEHRIRQALGRGDYKAARRAVNGGTNGFNRFSSSMRDGREFIRRYLSGEAVSHAVGARKWR